MGRKRIFKNISATLLLHLITIINGLVVPKIIISCFGSEANGLMTSINQFLNYVTLFEGGLSGVVLASLYKPILDNDQKKISAIFNATQRFFKQIGLIYIIYAVGVAFIYPAVVGTSYSYSYVALLTIVLALNLFTQYFFSISYQMLIRASQKVSFISNTKSIVMLLNILLIVVCTKLFPDLILIKAISATVLFLQPVVFSIYVKKHFELDKTVPRDDESLKQRWDGFGHTLAYFVNTNVSVFMLTAFSTLKVVSIYSVYIMITNALRNLSVSIASALMPSFGGVMAKGDERATGDAFSLYAFGMGFFSALMFTCGMVLVVPFIKLYTANVTDANYVRPVFGVILMLAEMIYCMREPYINAAYTAGHFKQTTKYAYGEVILNIVGSFILVQKFDLIGVALGLFIAMTYRFIAHIVYLKNNIIHRPISQSAKLAAFLIIPSALVAAAAFIFLPLGSIGSYFSWVIYAGVVFVAELVVLFVVSSLVFKKELFKIIGRKR